MIILKIIIKSSNHLEIDDILIKAKKINSGIGIATIYRTLNLFCEAGLLCKHDFDNYKIIYEKSDIFSDHHHHIVDLKNNELIEFMDEEIDIVLEKICNKYGYKMKDHKVEIYGEKIKK